MKKSVGLLVAIAVSAATLPGASAADPAEPGNVISVSAMAGVLAEPVLVAHDVVGISIVTRGAYDLSSSTETEVIGAALAASGSWSMSRGASVPMHAVRRGPAVVQQAPDGFDIPMSTTTLPISTVAQLMGRGLAGVLSNGYVVISRTTAGLRGAQVGDALDLHSAGGALVQYVVGSIVDDNVIGDTEILMSTGQGERLGITADTRIIMWGFSSRDAIDQQLAATDLVSMSDVRIRRSWDAFDPDSAIGMAQTKAALGEFAYRVRSNGTDLDVTSDWESSFIPAAREVLTAAIPIRARCNVNIKADLKAALDEIAANGLGGAIDVANANAAGGCYYPRFNRIGGTLGFLSRHSWGQALDTNTNTNPQGGVPTMNCDVVRIFRKHNFAWGGNFVRPDGMHFEWVGTRRDQYRYSSKYCPNLPSVATGTQAAATHLPVAVPIDPANGLSTMFADDGTGGD
jgi:hypothetical protein